MQSKGCESPLAWAPWCGICHCGSHWQQCTLLTQLPAPREVAALQGHLMGSAKVDDVLVSVLTHCLPGSDCLWLSVSPRGCQAPACWGAHPPSSDSCAMASHAVAFLSWLWGATITELLQWPNPVSFILSAAVPPQNCLDSGRILLFQRDGCCFHSLERCGMPRVMQTGMLMGIRGESRRYLDPRDSLVI